MTFYASGSARRAIVEEVERLAVGPPRSHWVNLWLRVQLDAVRFDPVGYFQAVAWRVRGLKLRSRNRIAVLAGRSRWAYPFWIARREPRMRSIAKDGSGPALPGIWPIIDCSGGTEGIRDTLESLPSGAVPIVVGGPALLEVVQIRSINELAGHIDEPEFWICPINCGDRLASRALDTYAAAIAVANAPGALYADDDLIDRSGERTSPHFKPDWNPELFEHHDFVTGAWVVRTRRDRVKSLPETGWAKALIDEAACRGPAPIHLPFVLHHRRQRPQPVIPAKPAQIRLTNDSPLVTVVIPTRNRADLLRKCVEGLRRTEYPRMEIIVVDNECDEPDAIALLAELKASGAEVLPVTGEFNFSRLNNIAAGSARGDLLCLLNNDVEILDPDWLALLVRQAVRPDIGAVGARLLYPDGTVQHAGVFIGIGGGAAHGHRLIGKDEAGYFDRARLPQRISAVTAACLAVSREKFLAVGGFDEENFPVAFNDVDLCLKLNRRGWQSFYEPRATLIHHESKSRGSDRLKINRRRFAGELEMLKRKWKTDEQRDPFHHPQLSSFCEQFLIHI